MILFFGFWYCLLVSVLFYVGLKVYFESTYGERLKGMFLPIELSITIPVVVFYAVYIPLCSGFVMPKQRLAWDWLFYLFGSFQFLWLSLALYAFAYILNSTLCVWMARAASFSNYIVNIFVVCLFYFS